MNTYTSKAFLSLFALLSLGASSIQAAPAAPGTTTKATATEPATNPPTSSVTAEPTPAPHGLFVAIPENAWLQSDKTVQPYGGPGGEDWEFKFFEPATYTQEVFKVSFYDGSKTATPTEVVHCTASATASPKEDLWVNIVPTSAFVAQTSIPAPYGVHCTRV